MQAKRVGIFVVAGVTDPSRKPIDILYKYLRAGPLTLLCLSCVCHLLHIDCACCLPRPRPHSPSSFARPSGDYRRTVPRSSTTPAAIRTQSRTASRAPGGTSSILARRYGPAARSPVRTRQSSDSSVIHKYSTWSRPGLLERGTCTPSNIDATRQEAP